jgi:hypothetical protein
VSADDQKNGKHDRGLGDIQPPGSSHEVGKDSRSCHDFSLLSFCENNFYETGLLVCWYMNAQPLREFPTSSNISAERLCCFPGGDESQLSEKRRRRLEAYRREEFVIRWVLMRFCIQSANGHQ